jgi:hypothetical protein
MDGPRISRISTDKNIVASLDAGKDAVGGTPTEAVETTALPGIIALHPFEQGLILSPRFGAYSLIIDFALPSGAALPHH